MNPTRDFAGLGWFVMLSAFQLVARGPRDLLALMTASVTASLVLLALGVRMAEKGAGDGSRQTVSGAILIAPLLVLAALSSGDWDAGSKWQLLALAATMAANAVLGGLDEGHSLPRDLVSETLRERTMLVSTDAWWVLIATSVAAAGAHAADPVSRASSLLLASLCLILRISRGTRGNRTIH